MNKPLTKSVDPEPAHEGDLYGWALHQAGLLRAGRLNAIDAAHIAEELDDLAGAQYDKLASALRVLLTHMLKWDFQPTHRGASWRATIREHRRRVKRLLEKNPSLKARLEEARVEAWEDAFDRAVAETGLPDTAFPADLPYSWHDILERPFTLDEA